MIDSFEDYVRLFEARVLPRDRHSGRRSAMARCPIHEADDERGVGITITDHAYLPGVWIRCVNAECREPLSAWMLVNSWRLIPEEWLKKNGSMR